MAESKALVAEREAVAEQAALAKKAASAEKRVRITLTGDITTHADLNKTSHHAQPPADIPTPRKSNLKNPQSDRLASGTRRVTLKDKVEIRKYRRVELLDGWQGGDLGIEDRVTEASLNPDKV